MMLVKEESEKELIDLYIINFEMGSTFIILISTFIVI